MRLAEGIVIDKEKTFGILKFSALRREVRQTNEDGTVSDIVKERTYQWWVALCIWKSILREISRTILNQHTNQF